MRDPPPLHVILYPLHGPPPPIYRHNGTEGKHPYIATWSCINCHMIQIAWPSSAVTPHTCPTSNKATTPPAFRSTALYRTYQMIRRS